jgi:uncharacterized membrane protein YdbT with pleckstrin-like domain
LRKKLTWTKTVSQVCIALIISLIPWSWTFVILPIKFFSFQNCFC